MFRRLLNSFASPASIAARLGEAGRNLVTDRDGNMAIMTVLLLPVTLFFFGGAIDFTRANVVRSDLVESLDAAGLAVARLAETPTVKTMNAGDRANYLKEYGENLFYENFQHENLVRDLNVEFIINSTTITPTATGKLDTLILGAAGRAFSGTSEGWDYFDLSIDTEITRQGSGRVEVAMVLDVTGSMGNSVGGTKKIVSLRDSVDKMLDILYADDTSNEFVKMGIVPFNAYVNPGAAASWSDDWTNEDGDGLYHGVRFFHVESDGDVDAATSVNHLDLFNSVTGTSWKGCVEARPYPLDELDISPTGSVTSSEISTAPNMPSELSNYSSLSTEKKRIADAYNAAPSIFESISDLQDAGTREWVPMFILDDPDCDRSDSTCDDGISNTSSYSITVGSVNTTRSYANYMFDGPSAGGHDRNDYDDSWINDERYIDPGEFPGDNFERYLYVVHQFRDMIQGAASNSAFQDYLDSMAADNINDEYILRGGYPGWWNPSTSKYEGKYDLPGSIDETISDTDSSTNGPNEGCPAPILPLTNVRGDIEDYMDTLFPAGYTNAANGAVWGWRLLSPEAPFSEGIGPSDPDYNKWKKAVVIMTDGMNELGSKDTHWRTTPTAYGYGFEERMGAGINTETEMEDQIDEKLLRICYRMKQEGYLVYTVMFGLSTSDGDAIRPIYEACATKPDEPYFFDIDDGADLEEAFENIAADLVKLHISR